MDGLITLDGAVAIAAVYLLAEIVFGLLPAGWFGEGNGRRKLGVVMVAAFAVSATIGEGINVSPQEFLQAGLALAVQAVFANEALKTLLPGDVGDEIVSGRVQALLRRE